MNIFGDLERLFWTSSTRSACRSPSPSWSGWRSSSSSPGGEAETAVNVGALKATDGTLSKVDAWPDLRL